MKLARLFSSSSATLARNRHIKRINRLHKHWAKEMFRPTPEYVDPVLGRARVPFLERVKAELALQSSTVSGLDAQETSKLLYGAELAQNTRKNFEFVPQYAQEEEKARQVLARITTLENASKSAVRELGTKLAIAEFAREDGDTGSPEVQAAVKTIRIQYLAQHVKMSKQDLQSKVRLHHLVQQRRNMLLYLKRKDPKRYMWTIEKLGLSDEAVTKEFHLSRRYLWDTQFYGERTLPLKKTKRDTQIQRNLERKREKAERYLAHNDPEALETIKNV